MRIESRHSKNSEVKRMPEEIDYVEDVEIKAVRNNQLKIESEDLPIKIIFESRKEYILMEGEKGLLLNRRD